MLKNSAKFNVKLILVVRSRLMHYTTFWWTFYMSYLHSSCVKSWVMC